MGASSSNRCGGGHQCDDDEWVGIPRPSWRVVLMAPDGASTRLRSLVDTMYGSGLGLQESAQVRGEVVELVAQLEAAIPPPHPSMRLTSSTEIESSGQKR